MPKIKRKPEEIWSEYEKGTQKNANLYDGRGLYDVVEENERFYTGDHWHGVDAPDLDKPVINFTKRVVNYHIAMLVSDDISTQLSPFGGERGKNDLCEILGEQVDRVVERCKLKAQSRDALRNAAVDGDADWYFTFDADAEGGQGEITLETLENTKVIFGNPYVCEVAKQPYILIPRRQTIEELRDRAVGDGMSETDAQTLTADSESIYGEDDGGELATSVVKFWRESGTIRWIEVTRDRVIRKERDTGYARYPIAHMPWEKTRNSYHGQSVMTGMIPNQRFVNKAWAMMMAWLKGMAMPKIIYNELLLPGGWDSRMEAIGVQGPPADIVAQNYRPPELSAMVLGLVDRTISATKDAMGANDAALGNVKPDNTTAIIAVQKATAAPLDLQRLAYYQFLEDAVRIICEIMRVDYGVRWVPVKDDSGLEMLTQVDFAALDLADLDLRVDVGPAAYWSQLTQIQSADALLKAGVIADAEDYLEQIPDGVVRNKQQLLKNLRDRREEQQAAAQAQAQAGAAAPAAAGALPAGV